jgi:hypothetical protein
MEWLLLAMVGVVILMYAAFCHALALDALWRGPTQSEGLSGTTAERRCRPKHRPSGAPGVASETEPDSAADGAGR